ncbi:unnamed protein product [Knipowitschia caucasica]
MPPSRMRMRPWLEKIIDSEEVQGLQWLDREKRIFSVPWVHGARHGWELHKDASLFKLWAVHTGKYVEGQRCDPKTWKANFRCAMNSLPDIEEVKDQSVHKGHQAVRVFRMLPVAPKNRVKRSRPSKSKTSRKLKYEEESSDSDIDQSPTQSSCLSTPAQTPSPAHRPSPAHFPSAQDCSVDSTVHTDFSYMSPEGVPGWSSSVEVEFYDMTRTFQVSPPHSSCPDDEEIVQICAQWERERLWNLSLNSGLLTNAQRTSPGSQYSEASSGEDLEELHPQYTSLSSTLPPTDDLFNCLYPFTQHYQ